MTDVINSRFKNDDLVTHAGRPATIAGVYRDVKGSVRYHIFYNDEGKPEAAFFLYGRVLSPREEQA